MEFQILNEHWSPLSKGRPQYNTNENREENLELKYELQK